VAGVPLTHGLGLAFPQPLSCSKVHRQFLRAEERQNPGSFKNRAPPTHHGGQAEPHGRILHNLYDAVAPQADGSRRQAQSPTKPSPGRSWLSVWVQRVHCRAAMNGGGTALRKQANISSLNCCCRPRAVKSAPGRSPGHCCAACGYPARSAASSSARSGVIFTLSDHRTSLPPCRKAGGLRGDRSRGRRHAREIWPRRFRNINPDFIGMSACSPPPWTRDEGRTVRLHQSGRTCGNQVKVLVRPRGAPLPRAFRRGRPAPMYFWRGQRRRSAPGGKTFPPWALAIAN
jgi:hypothetical protein